MCCCGEGGGEQGGGGQGGGGVSHIGAGIILSAFCSLALFCFMFKVVFIVPVSVHGPEFKRVYVPNIIILAVKFRKICIE